MNVLPVITRELRAQARQPFTYWLRVLGLVAMIGAAGAFVVEHGLTPGSGGRMFAFLHGTLLLSIWVLVPMSVADCLSQERREGTLGLLLLTPLRPWDIVLAKAAAHALRAFTLWLVVLPGHGAGVSARRRRLARGAALGFHQLQFPLRGGWRGRAGIVLFQAMAAGAFAGSGFQRGWRLVWWRWAKCWCWF